MTEALKYIVLLAAAALVSCRKNPPERVPAQVPLTFKVTAGELKSKAVTNKDMGTAYDKNESFVVYSVYSQNPFPASYENFWDGNGLTCSYNNYYDAWAPNDIYYWPMAGYLTFQAYSPAGTGVTVNHSWTNGFSFPNFTVPAEGSQYDLLYSTRAENCRRADYIIPDGNAYDDDPDYPSYIYNGINLAFSHALSLIEVQTSSSLGSNASTKYYVQKIELKNAYNNGSFAQSTVDPTTGDWTVNTSAAKVDYTVLDKTPDDWQLVPGADETPVSVNLAQTLMLLPQTLDRGTAGTFESATDAYLYVTYKEGASGVTQVAQIPLTEPWVRGNKYTYKIVFSSYIEFTALITDWENEIIGYHRIII